MYQWKLWVLSYVNFVHIYIVDWKLKFANFLFHQFKACTVQVIGVFPMLQTGTGVSVEPVDLVF